MPKKINMLKMSYNKKEVILLTYEENLKTIEPK
jgi:hypothetical protein